MNDPEAPPRVKKAARQLIIEIGKAVGLDLGLISSDHWKTFYVRD